MAQINKNDNMNQGLPDNTGLDETTRARLRAAADGGNDGIVVGSFADLQRGTVGDPTSAPLNPNVPEEANLVTPAENDAQLGTTTVETEREGLTVEGQADYDDMTKEELQAEAEARGVATSGTKDEIRARLS